MKKCRSDTCSGVSQSHASHRGEAGKEKERKTGYQKTFEREDGGNWEKSGVGAHGKTGVEREDVEYWQSE